MAVDNLGKKLRVRDKVAFANGDSSFILRIDKDNVLVMGSPDYWREAKSVRKVDK